MPESLQSALLPQMEAALILAVGAGLPALFLYMHCRRKPLFPDAAPAAAPWNGWAFLIAFAFTVLIQVLVQVGLVQVGFPGMLYGPDFPQRLLSNDDLKTPNLRHAANVLGLWSQTIAAPIQLVVIVLALRYGFGARLAQIGLSADRWRPNYVLGYLGWWALAPVSYAVFMLAIALLTPNPDTHPLMDLGPYGKSREWILFALQVVVFAPINEELLFRGVLLFWLLKPPASAPLDAETALPPLKPEVRAHVVVLAAVFLSLQFQSLQTAIANKHWDRFFVALSPCLLMLILVPFYFLLPASERLRRVLRLNSAQAPRACIASSMLFAAVHSTVWPSPIPLFVLGLGLAWLAIRTGSIVPAIIVHMLFNAVAAVAQLVGGS